MNIEELKELFEKAQLEQAYSKEDDVLWEKIEAELPPTRKNRPIIYLLIIFGLLLAIGSVFIYRHFNHKQAKPITSTTGIDENLTQSSNEISTESVKAVDHKTGLQDFEVNNIHSTSVKAESAPIAQNSHLRINETSSNAEDAVQQNNAIDNETEEVIHTSGKTAISQTEILPAAESMNSSKTSSVETDKILNAQSSQKEMAEAHLRKADQSKNDIEENLALAATVAKDQDNELPLLPFSEFSLLDREQAIILDEKIAESTTYSWERPTAPATSNKGLRWSVEGGVHQQTANFKLNPEQPNESLLSSKERFESTVYGIQTGLYVDYPIKKSLFIRSGLGYKEYWNKISRMEEVRDKVLLENQLLSIVVDPGTRAPIDSVYGDTLVNRTRTINLRQYSKYTQLRVPIILAYQWETKSPLFFEASAGVGFNFWLSRTGNTWNNQLELVNVDDSDSNILNGSQFALSAQLGFALGYEISNKIAVYVRPEIEFGLTNWYSSSYGVQYTPTDFGVVAGISYRMY